MPDFPELLRRTSRTFGLSIPLLEEPCRREVTLAYLVFRVADTLEDSHRLPPRERSAQLDRLVQLLRQPDVAAARALAASWRAEPPCQHSGYLDLLQAFPELLEAICRIGPPAQGVILQHARRTAQGMKRFLAMSDDRGGLTLTSLEQLRGYCYVVAGIVGELLTELFLHHHAQLQPAAESLRSRARWFGEGLQLVNILKDAEDDAREGRCYLPPEASLDSVFQLARDDLNQADHYVQQLRAAAAPEGLIAFTELPVVLARGTLQAVRQQGPGAKLTRTQVAQMLTSVQQAGRQSRPRR